MSRKSLASTSPVMVLLLTLAAHLALVAPALANRPSGVLVDPAMGKSLTSPAVNGLLAFQDLASAEDALVVDPGLQVIALTVAGFERARPEALRHHYESGRTIMVLNGQISLLAKALLVETDLPDLYAQRAASPIESIALVMPLVDEVGELDGHYAFTDFVDGAGGVASVVAQITRQAQQSPQAPMSKASCSGVTPRSDVVNYTGPAGTNVKGATLTHCTYDSVNSFNAVFGYVYTTSSGHDQVKVTVVVYNNCGHWHQISDTIKYGTTLAEVAWPGLQAGIPGCGNKWLSNTVHSARKGSVWFSRFTSACAGSGC